MFETVTLDAKEFYLEIISPAFQDLVPTEFPFKGMLNEFTIMDDVRSSKTIVNIKRVANVLQRRDASCDINYKRVMGATTRKITTEEVYGATKFCRNEFYQGCLKDFRAKDPIFVDKILPFFQEAVLTDVASNAYFGDVERVIGANAQWSTNIFDGIFTWIKRFIASNAIPSAQTLAIADNTDFSTTPTAAYTLLKSMYDKQPVLMNSFTDSSKAFIVSKEIASGYEDYLTTTATTGGNITYLQNGIKQLSFKGIPVLVEELWTPIITEIKGSKGYAAVLTLRGNFVFGTDKTYGEGEDGNTALEVWYEKKDMTWYYRWFLKAGTNIALPEYIVVALTSFS